LFRALDAILGEGRDAILTDATDAQAAVFGEHIDRKFIFLWKTTPAVLTFDLRAKFRIQIAGFEDQVIGRFDVRAITIVRAT
jgi:hypothetical protein